jgi:hypothetical protein
MGDERIDVARLLDWAVSLERWSRYAVAVCK